MTNTQIFFEIQGLIYFDSRDVVGTRTSLLCHRIRKYSRNEDVLKEHGIQAERIPPDKPETILSIKKSHDNNGL